MALLDFKGFENIASSSIDMRQFPNYLQSTSAGHTKVAGQLGGFALSSSSGLRNLIYSDGNNYATLVVGLRIKLPSSFTNSTELVLFKDANFDQFSVAVGTDGKLKAYRGDSGGTLLATGTAVLSVDSYIYLEVKITLHNSTGAYDIRLGGVTELTATGADTCTTANNFANLIEFPVGTNASNSIDDLYILDTTGGSPHNDFLGPVRIETGLVTTNGSSTQFTPLSSTNSSNVDDTNGAPDDDTTYNLSGTSGHIDLFNHGALSATPVTIFATAVYSRARKDDVSNRQLRNKLKSGATTVSGVSTSIDTTYKYIRDQYIVDPNTAAAWTTSNVNATEIGYEHV